MNKVAQLFIEMTKRWWLVLLVTVANFVSFRLLFLLEEHFTDLTGLQVFDTQNDLTPVRLLEQLPVYIGEARRAYNAFAAFDYVFPFVAAFFLVVLWTLLLRVNSSGFAKQLLSRNLSLLPFVTTLFDWLENLSIAGVLASSSAPRMTFVNAAVLFKRLKLSSLALIGLLTLALVLFTLITILLRSRAKS
jgi:hypothetical protein